MRAFGSTCFPSTNKVQFVPSWCAAFSFLPQSRPLQGPHPSCSPSSLSILRGFPLPGPAWPSSRAPCHPGRVGGLSLHPEEPNASLSLCLSLCVCVCVCVSPLPRVFLLLACSPSHPVAAFLPHTPSPAHPESRSLAVLAPLQDVDVGAGEMALFECLVAGPTDVEVDWLCRGRLLQPALLKCKMHFDGRKCKLLLTSVHEDDSGVYTCKLSTAKGESRGCRRQGLEGELNSQPQEGTPSAGERARCRTPASIWWVFSMQCLAQGHCSYGLAVL